MQNVGFFCFFFSQVTDDNVKTLKKIAKFILVLSTKTAVANEKYIGPINFFINLPNEKIINFIKGTFLQY